MAPQNLMPSVGSIPIDLQCSDGGIVNVRVMADKEHNTFAIGRFQRRADFGGDLTNTGDFHEQGGKAGALQILHIRQQGGQGGLADRGKRHVTVYDPPYATGRVDMLAVYDSVVNMILDAIDGMGKQSAVNHDIVYVCEGLETAKALALGLNAPGLS